MQIVYNYIVNRNKAIFALAALLAFTCSGFSQHILRLGVEVSPGYSMMGAKMPSFLSGRKSAGAFSFNGGVSAKYFINKNFGLSSGIQFLSFNQTAKGDSSYESFFLRDSEDSLYERRVWGKNIMEKTTLGVIHIPLHLFYYHPLNRKVAVYASAGAGITIPIRKKYTGSGTFTYIGYYPNLGAELYSIPLYGFASDTTINTSNNLSNRLITFNIVASIGVTFTINRYYKFFTAVNYYRSVSSVVKENGNYHISNEVGSFNSFLGYGSGVLSNISVSIGITKDILF